MHVLGHVSAPRQPENQAAALCPIPTLLRAWASLLSGRHCQECQTKNGTRGTGRGQFVRGERPAQALHFEVYASMPALDAKIPEFYALFILHISGLAGRRVFPLRDRALAIHSSVRNHPEGLHLHPAQSQDSHRFKAAATRQASLGRFIRPSYRAMKEPGS